MKIVDFLNNRKNGKDMPMLSFSQASIIVFTLFCCTLIPASGFAEWGCAAASVVCFAFLLLAVRSRAAVLTIAIPALFAYFATASFLLPSLILSIPVSVGAGAFLVNGVRKYYLLALIPAFYFISFALCTNWMISLLSLIGLPAIIVLAHAAHTNAPRLGAICRISVTLAIMLLLCLIPVLSFSNIGFSLDAIRSAIDSAKATVVSWLEAQMALDPMLFEALGVSAEQYASAAFAILPALIICSLNFISFSAQQINLSLMKASEFSKFVSQSASEFIMSPAAAVTFFGAILLMVISPNIGNGAVGSLAENLFMIFMPGLVLVGLMRSLGKYGKKRFGFFTIVFFVMLFLTQTWIWLILMSVIGAFTVLMTAFSGKKKKTT